MYLDNSLNKLLPSCLLLPLLLRVISVLIVFLSIWSHCFSGLFLCYFLSTKINYKYPFELGAGDVQTQQSGIPPECFPSPAVCQLAERATGSARSGTFHGVVQKQGFLNVIKSRVTQDTACCSVATFSICCGKLGLGNGLSPICTMVTTQLINAASLEEFLNPR